MKDLLKFFILFSSLLMNNGLAFKITNESNNNNQITTIDEQRIFSYESNFRRPDVRKTLYFPENNSEDISEKAKKRRRRKRKNPTIPPINPHPQNIHKKDIQWFDESRSFALKLSADGRFPLRMRPDPLQGSPWPLPQQYDSFEQAFIIQPDVFTFHAAGETCDILRYTFRRIRKNIFGTGTVQSDGYDRQNQDDKNEEELRQMNVTVLKPCSKWPSLSMDESYDLEVRRYGAAIIAREVWGAIRALETFGQLVYRNSKNIYRINRTLINDFPRFPHRGILLDTSRHYLTKKTILLNLEAMAQNKMNVLHWHIVDDQSFPFVSQVYPNISRKGAYSENHVYTPSDIAEILDEARLRGIRVIPEFDTPGHTWSWGLGQDFLLTPCFDSFTMKHNEMFGPINPILRGTYTFLKNLFSEVLQVFKDKYVHLGGDEVPFDCWLGNPHIDSFMRRNNLTSARQLLAIYEKKLFDIINDLGNKRQVGSGYIVWQEVFDNGIKLHPDTIVEIWMGDATDIERVTNSGLKAIYSSCWYLDNINTGVDWDKYYLCEQLDPSLLSEMNLKNISLLIGGEACMWSEYTDNENIIARLWPRASAAAERLWSNKNVRNVQAAGSRIEMQRCRMLDTGIPVGVLSGPGDCPNALPGIGNRNDNSNGVLPKNKNPNKGLSSENFQVQHFEKSSNFAKVYLVDMSAMYVIPVIIVFILFIFLMINSSTSDTKVIPIISRNVGRRPLLTVFILFIIVWIIWSAPIWLNSWEGLSTSRRMAH